MGELNMKAQASAWLYAGALPIATMEQSQQKVSWVRVRRLL
jgi:hypothetical protein